MRDNSGLAFNTPLPAILLPAARLFSGQRCLVRVYPMCFNEDCGDSRWAALVILACGRRSISPPTSGFRCQSTRDKRPETRTGTVPSASLTWSPKQDVNLRSLHQRFQIIDWNSKEDYVAEPLFSRMYVTRVIPRQIQI